MDFTLDVKDILISDPFILADEKSGMYYMYSQMLPGFYPDFNRCNGIFVYMSKDLIHWTMPVIAYDGEKDNFWGKYDFWAPECHIWNGKYYIISSYRGNGTLRRCQFLVSDSPTGPFTASETMPVTPAGWQCLDGTLYADKEAAPWLVFVHEWLQVGDGQIAALKLSEDLSQAVSDPIILFRASDAPWAAPFYDPDSTHNGWVTDGPFLYKMNDGSLIMLWSNFTKDGYAVGYAKSQSGTIFGPWIQQKNPLFFLDGGHAMLFKSFDGQLLMALHCPNSPHKAKRLLIFTMEDKNGRLSTVNEITGNWYNNAKGPADGWLYKEEYNDIRGLNS